MQKKQQQQQGKIVDELFQNYSHRLLFTQLAKICINCTYANKHTDRATVDFHIALNTVQWEIFHGCSMLNFQTTHKENRKKRLWCKGGNHQMLETFYAAHELTDFYPWIVKACILDGGTNLQRKAFWEAQL